VENLAFTARPYPTRSSASYPLVLSIRVPRRRCPGLPAVGAFLGPFIVAFAHSAVHSVVALRPSPRLSASFRAIGFSKGKYFRRAWRFRSARDRSLARDCIYGDSPRRPGTSDDRLLVSDAGFDARKTVKYGIRQSFLWIAGKAM